MPPIAQPAEAVDLKSIQSGFESQWGDVVLAKVVLIVAILIAITLGVFMRVRAWRRRRAQAKAAWQAELDRDLRR